MTGRFTPTLASAGYAVATLAAIVGAGTALADDGATARTQQGGEVVFAVADIVGCRGEGLLGRALLVEQPSDQGVKKVVIRLKVAGLESGSHGVHIHETAECGACGSAGGHFDPGPDSNTSPDGNHPFHMGDLENIHVADSGIGQLDVLTTRVTLSPGPLSLFDKDGSAFIIHDFEDTFCPEGVVTGCAGGSRAACGVIERF